MKKIILWGDGILAGPAGFAELLVNHIFLHRPRAEVATAIYGGERVSVHDALRETPLHVIGKAPDLVLLGFGYTDVADGINAAEIGEIIKEMAQLIVQKTEARLCIPTVVPGFFSDEADQEQGRVLNKIFREMDGPRITLLDLESPVKWFLDQHKQSAGEKHALHLDHFRLTPLGRLFLAHHSFGLIPWPA